MGLFTKSFLILAIAVSTPLIYRQFATENTIKFMSNYYSNYNVIDRYLRQGASHIDQAKDYLPDSKQLQQVYEKLNKQFNQFLNPAQAPTSNKKDGPAEKSASQANSDQTVRMTNCPGEQNQVRLWSKDELSKYDGKSGSADLYLSFLGVVYNVTVNAKHYGPGADYNAFTGRDATRAFVTGDFTRDLHDDVRNIDEKLYSHIEAWDLFYSSSFQQLGRVEGAYYDSRGCPTAELDRVHGVFAKLAQEKASQSETDKALPECNSEWNADLKQSRVWCSNKSGGVERDWVGVPRIYQDADSKRCVCLNLNSPDVQKQAATLSLYPGCDASASECTFKQ